MKNHRLISLLLVLTLLAGILIPGAIAADEEEPSVPEAAIEDTVPQEPEQPAEEPAPKQEPAQDEPKQEEPKQEEPEQEEPKQEEPKQEEPEEDEPKQEEPGSDSVPASDEEATDPSAQEEETPGDVQPEEPKQQEPEQNPEKKEDEEGGEDQLTLTSLEDIGAKGVADGKVTLSTPATDGEDYYIVINENGKAKVKGKIFVDGVTKTKHIKLQAKHGTTDWENVADTTVTWDSNKKKYTIEFKVLKEYVEDGNDYEFQVATTKSESTSPVFTLKRAFTAQTSAPAAENAPGISQTVKLKAYVNNANGTLAGTAKYQWYFSTNGTKFKKYTGDGATSNKAKITIDADGKAYGYWYRCEITGDNGSATTNAVQIPKPFPAEISATNSKPGLDDAVEFKVEAPPEGATFQWQKYASGKWSNLKKKTGQTYTINQITEADYGISYRALITSGGKTVNSNAITLERPYRLVVSIDNPAKPGIGQTTKAVSSVEDGECQNPVYHWEASSDGNSWGEVSDIPCNDPWYGFEGADNEVLTITGHDDVYSLLFRLRVEADNGRAVSPTFKFGKPYTVTVNANPASAGIGVKFTLTATVKKAPSDVTYQWERWDVDEESGTRKWNPIAGATGSTYKKKAKENDYDNVKFRCVVTAQKDGGNVIVHSNEVAISRPFRIKTTSPADGVVTAGMDDTPEFSITKIKGATGTVKYQWQKWDNGWNDIKKKATSASYKPGKPEAVYGARYRCVVTADNGIVYSREFTVRSPFTATIRNDISDSNCISVGLHKWVQLTANLADYILDDSYTPLFVPQKSTNNGASWTSFDSFGAREDAAFTVTVEDETYDSLFRTRIELWKDDSLAYAMYTEPVSFVQPFVPYVGPEPMQVSVGQSVTFTAEAPENEPAPSDYQWYVKNGNEDWWEMITGETGEDYVLVVDESVYGKKYRCEVTIGGEIAATKEVYVNHPFTVSVNSPKIALGGTATLTATLNNLEEGTVITGYEWQYSADGGGTWQDAGGLFTAAENVLTVGPTIADYYNADEANPQFVFRCTVSVSNPLIGSVDSNIAQIRKQFAVDTNNREQQSDSSSKIKFKVFTSKAATTFTWRYSEDNGKTWNKVKKQGTVTNASDMKSSTLQVSVNSKTNVDNYCRLFRCDVTISNKIVASEPFYVEPVDAINYDYVLNDSGATYTLAALKDNAPPLAGEIVVPVATHGVRVSSIGDSVFQNKTGITSVRIPKHVKSIGAYAFEGCSGITKVELPNTVEEIGQAAYKDCSSLSVMNPY